MHIVVVTRHLARATTVYAPVFRALLGGDVRVCVLAPPSTWPPSLDLEALALSRVEAVSIRPLGEPAAPLEWTLISGRLLAIAEEDEAPIDVLMSFEPELSSVLVAAGRAAGVRLIVPAAERPEGTASLLNASQRSALASLWDAAPSLREALTNSLQQVVTPALGQVVRPAVDQVLQPALEQVVRPAVDQVLQSSFGHRLQQGLQQVGATLPIAKSAIASRAQKLRKLLVEGAPVHWLLTKPPVDPPEGGSTDFGYGVGVDVEFWTPLRELSQESVPGTLRIGVWRDPWVSDANFAHLETTLKGALVRAQAEERVELVPIPRLTGAAAQTCAERALTHLQTLDVAVVPPNDLYALMQAQAAGVLVVTQERGAGAAVVRAGETGHLLPWLDAVNLGGFLQSLPDAERLEELKLAAERRALRYFDSAAWIRRFSRNLDERLTMDPEAEGLSDSEDEGDLSGPLGREIRRHI